MDTRPTLLSACAKAATAAEARYRVDYPNSKARATRILALNEAAAGLMRRITEAPWNGAHFLTFVASRSPAGLEMLPVDAVLRTPDGAETSLIDELNGADVVVMIATAGSDAEAAAIVGNACSVRSIMTAGLVVARGGGVDAAVSALRPYAAVLVVASDEEYVPEMLTALRA